jgi:hypothetical protein
MRPVLYSLVLAAAACLMSGAASAQGAEPPQLEFAFEVRAEVADPLIVGDLPQGTRRIIDILGGTVEGPGIGGKILPGGADWQMIRRSSSPSAGASACSSWVSTARARRA